MARQIRGRPQSLILARPVEDEVRVRARAVGHHGRAEERDGVFLEQRLLGRRPRRRRRRGHPRDVVKGAPVAREPRRPRALLGAPVPELVPHSPPPAHLGSDNQPSCSLSGRVGLKEIKRPVRAGVHLMSLAEGNEENNVRGRKADPPRPERAAQLKSQFGCGVYTATHECVVPRCQGLPLGAEGVFVAEASPWVATPFASRVPEI